MAKILRIYSDYESILRLTCRKVETISDFREFYEDLWATMKAAGALGLAANQVGHDYRIIAVDTKDISCIMVNPVIYWKSVESIHFQEMCLSVPDLVIDTGNRSKTIKVEYCTTDGKKCDIILTGEAAVVVQHEVDHLNGTLMVDHIPELLQDMDEYEVEINDD